jgi:large subunit ribosomal protein L23
MSIIKKPVLTEKYTAMNGKGKYAFVVDLKANKVEIAKEIKRLYGVEVESVQTMRQLGKKRSRSTRRSFSTGFTSTIKKAIVTVAAGEVLDFYQGI